MIRLEYKAANQLKNSGCSLMVEYDLAKVDVVGSNPIIR